MRKPKIKFAELIMNLHTLTGLDPLLQHKEVHDTRLDAKEYICLQKDKKGIEK